MVGRTIGKYKIVDQIGKGGMGTVYAAIDETLDRRVAIKILNADLIDQDAVERFRREAMTLARLNHGRIGAIHELTRDGHDLLMVMEFLEGETFEKLIEHGPMAIPRAISLVTQILDALQYAHAAGVVHRDLKPANIILTPSGEVKVMDFGIARVQGSEHLTTAGFMVGTPAYMAPEQVRGEEVDPRMDLYSLTVVLYRMLTQRLPFTGDTAIAMIHSQLNNPPTPPTQYRGDLPEWLVKVLDRGLCKAPADRFQTANEFRQALEAGLTGKMRLPTGVLPTDIAPTMMPTPTPAPPGMSSSVNTPAISGTGSAPASRPLTGSAPAPVAPVGNTGAMSATGGMPVDAPPAFPVPGAPAARPPKQEKTVVLRTPQLATAGVLFALLVIGVGVLAFIALRRPSTPESTDQAAVETPADSAAAPADAAAAPSPDAAAVPGTAAAAPAAGAATTAVPPPASTAPAGTAARAGGAGPVTGAAPPTGRAASPIPTTAAARGATPTPAPLAAAPITVPVAPVAAAAGRPPLPVAASAPAENFGDVRALVVDGARSREVDALLSLEPGNLVVRSRSDGSVLRTLSYGSIGAATYARARRPRGQTSPDVVDVPDNVGGSGLLGGARHWLTLQGSSEFLIVRLEDRNVIRVLNSIEARTGLKVQRNQE